jgi:hypothetical protein
LLVQDATAQTAKLDSSNTYPAKSNTVRVSSRPLLCPARPHTPFFATIFVGRQAANAVWEKRLFDRAEALLTTADGRIGIRPLSATSIGTGARLFFKDIWHDTDASLTSTLGVSGRKRQQHLLSLALPNSVRLVGGFIREPSESFYSIGNDGNGSKTSFRQEDIYGQLAYLRRVNGVLRLDATLEFRSGRAP